MQKLKNILQLYCEYGTVKKNSLAEKTKYR